MVNESTCLKLQSMVMGVFATDELMGRSSTMTSAPKKKWIQHYMQGITQSVFSTKNHVRHFTQCDASGRRALGIHSANHPSVLRRGQRARGTRVHWSEHVNISRATRPRSGKRTGGPILVVVFYHVSLVLSLSLSLLLVCVSALFQGHVKAQGRLVLAAKSVGLSGRVVVGDR